jgi:hypothetical protein
MGGHGPAPKDPAKRRRTNSDPKPTSVITPDGELRGPDLPIDVLPDHEQWHSRTRAWWRTWRRSPQAQAFTETDWDFLIDTALMHHTMWSKGRWEFASELRLRAAKFGATPEDRMRLRIQIDAAPAPEGEPKSSRYAHLRPVEDLPA